MVEAVARRDRDLGSQIRRALSSAQRCVMAGLSRTLERKRQDQPCRLPKLDGAADARLVQLACSTPPEGRSRWTLHLLCDQRVELGVVESVSHSTVQQRLQKNELKPWRVKKLEIHHTPKHRSWLNIASSFTTKDARISLRRLYPSIQT